MGGQADAIKAETRAFARYVREGSQDSLADYQAACSETEASLSALPFDYAQLGADRYARTWNLLQGYIGLPGPAGRLLAREAGAGPMSTRCTRSWPGRTIWLSMPLRLTQATLEQGDRGLQSAGPPAGPSALAVSGHAGGGGAGGC